MEGALHVGIDVSKLCLDVESFGHTTPKPLRLQVENLGSGFRELLRQALQIAQGTELRFCMESTGGYEIELASFLSRQGCYVSVVNPALVKHFIRSKGWTNKTDQVDAKAIAEFSARYLPRRWHLSDPIRLEIAQLRRHRERIADGLSRVRNYLEHRDQKSEFELKQLLEQQAQLLEHMHLTESRIAELVQADPKMRAQVGVLTGIKGIGTGFAIAILSELGDHEQYESAQQYAAMAGVSPCRNQSGSKTGRTRISKGGCRWVRTAGWMPAIVAMSCNTTVKALAERLKERGRTHKQIRIAAMRKLIMQAYGALKAHARAQTEQKQLKPIRFRTTDARRSAKKLSQGQTQAPSLGWRTKQAIRKRQTKT